MPTRPAVAVVGGGIIRGAGARDLAGRGGRVTPFTPFSPSRTAT